MSDFDELFEAQLDSVLRTGVAVSCVLHHGGQSLGFDGVADRYPARLTGVEPGDVRLRARAEDLPSAYAIGGADTVQDVGSGTVFNVVSAEPEFGGAGVCLQLRRVVTSQAGIAVPASATAAGAPGQMVSDANFLYVCVADSSWKRAVLSSW